MRSHEAAWVAELLILLPEVDVIDIRVGTHRLEVGDDYYGPLKAVELHVHAEGWEAAEALSQSLSLREGKGRTFEATQSEGTFHERAWQGWATEGSRDMPCWVRVIGAEYIPAIADPWAA